MLNALYNAQKNASIIYLGLVTTCGVVHVTTCA